MKINFLQSGIYISILCGLAACFNTREPAQPSSATSWISPTEQSILLDNFKKSVLELNLNNYERCLNKYLIFSPDRNLSGNNTGVFQTWTTVEELEYLKNLKARTVQTGANAFTFSNEQTNFLTADSLEYTANYNLFVYHQDSSYTATHFVGKCILSMHRNSSSEWAISRWQDNRTDAQTPCWTDLKQHFISP
ncbi:hypothetical protein SAMN05421780_10551 [Flexibacter flexilis DSM 6793]|uniref:SnoaL-like domain-containing protein n=1 Tax=Flexibacter flexilis DSM 6793 TaxID=927664 RepID=A0A1I1IQV8_9BACT|nr:hypothetical protein [Flexibacter flexilis]SFC38321.1 hypothetical protein SAMN05421780_10551 [Flexibacter flexilis DSM 6793]